MYLGVRLVVVCLFIYLYIIFIFNLIFLRGSHKMFAQSKYTCRMCRTY